MSCHIASRCGVIRWFDDADPQTAFDARKPFKASADYFELSQTAVCISNLISHDKKTMFLGDYSDLSTQLISLGFEWAIYERHGRLKIQHLPTMDVFDFNELVARA